MPPKQRYTHEVILEKAYEMFMSGGMSAVNARSVSKALNCSTQPIFSYFPDMNGLRSALVEEGFKEFSSTIEETSLSDDSPVSRCGAFVNFASRQPKVFNHLLALKTSDSDPQSILTEVPERILDSEAEKTGLSKEKLYPVFEKLNTYAIGLASLVASGKKPYDETQIKEELTEIYSALLHAEA